MSRGSVGKVGEWRGGALRGWHGHHLTPAPILSLPHSSSHSRQVVFPDKPSVSDECKDLMRQLLIKDPSKRLGTKLGAEEIKSHPFFAGINWAMLRNMKPPYVPNAPQVAKTSSTAS